jgi:hypothetical protein
MGKSTQYIGKTPRQPKQRGKAQPPLPCTSASRPPPPRPSLVAGGHLTRRPDLHHPCRHISLLCSRHLHRNRAGRAPLRAMDGEKFLRPPPPPTPPRTSSVTTTTRAPYCRFYLIGRGLGWPATQGQKRHPQDHVLPPARLLLLLHWEGAAAARWEPAPVASGGRCCGARARRSSS